jgi:hypothetical protein
MDSPLPDDYDPYEPEEMNEPNWYEIGLATLLAVFGWLFKRHVTRVDRIEDTYVSLEQLEKKHKDNVDLLTRIEQKIDMNEARDAKTRHEIRDSVHGLTTDIAVIKALAKREKDREPE